MWNPMSLQCRRMPSFLAIADFLRPRSLELGSTFIYGVRISFESFSGVNTTPVMGDDEKAVEHSEGQRRDGKEIHRGDSFPMIAEKGRPSLGRLRIPRRSPHPTQHGSLRKIEAKHFQFAVDARCAPGSIFRDHSKDEILQFLADVFSARPNPTLRDPRPIQLEACTVPA